MRKRALQPVDLLLDSLFRELGIADRIRLETLRRHWQTIFAGPIAIHTAPTELKGNKLIIAVDSPAWLQHLKFLNKEILGKVSTHGIKIIQFRLGSVRFESERKIPEKKASLEDFRELTDNERAVIDATLSNIADDELKDVIKHTMEKAASRKWER